MGCRKNQATLTAAEKTAFVNAVLAMKTRPSQMGLANRYDDYVQMHLSSMTGGNHWAHRRPAFLPWHREFLRRFELDLQAIDPSVDLPYWDWTVDNQPNSSVWGPDLMGGSGQGASQKVMDGPFAFDAGNWAINIHDTNDGGQPFLRRDFGTFPGVSALPTAQQVNDCLLEVPYDESTWNDSMTLATFRNRLEGWYGPGSIHNRVHLWVSGRSADPYGTMYYATSPNDPIFWLHHCNIDRLWSVWQVQNPTEGYHPTGVGVDTGPAGHNLPDSMQPWGGTSTVASEQSHHAMGYWYDTDAPVVTLTTPSLAFTDVPEGLGGAGITTYRAIVFEVQSCQPVTLQIVPGGPTGGFTTTALGSSVSVSGPGPGPGVGRLWIAYASTNPGDIATGSVTVEEVGTPTQWVISLSANTIARPRTAVVLSLDRSGSMSEQAGDGTSKHQKLVEAVEIFTDVMIQGDGLGMVSFDDQIDRLFDVADVGPQPAVAGSGRALAASALAGSGLDPRGLTAIGGAVVEGQDALTDAQAVASPPYDHQALVVLTDGVENVTPYVASIIGGITANTYAIGLGIPANISTAALDLLASSTPEGKLMITGTLTTDQQFRLSKFFLQILAGITSASIVVDPVGDLVYGPTHRIPFQITEADYGIDAILTSPLAPLIDFKLEAPDGSIIDPSALAMDPNASFVGRRLVSYYRLPLPVLGGSSGVVHAGPWTALLTLDKRLAGRDRDVLVSNAVAISRRALPYNLMVHGYSSLRLSATTDRSIVAPGESAGLIATLAEYGIPVERRAAVWAESTAPNGFVATVQLAETAPGTFTGALTASTIGVHTVRVRASGTTLHGTPFTREQTLSVSVLRSGAGAGDPFRELIDRLDDRDERMCELLRCLADESGLLERFGIEGRRLAECVDRYCKPAPRRTPRETVRRADTVPEPKPVRLQPSETLRNARIARSIEGLATGRPLEAGEELIETLVEPPAPAPDPEEVHDMTGPMFGLSQHDLDELPEDVRRAATNTPPMTPTRGARKTRKENI